VFSTVQNREGIQVGIAIALLSRRPKHSSPGTIHFRDFWGMRKREELVVRRIAALLLLGPQLSTPTTPP